MQVFGNAYWLLLSLLPMSSSVICQQLGLIQVHGCPSLNNVVTFGQLSGDLPAGLGGGGPASLGAILTFKRGLPHPADPSPPNHTDLSSPWEPGVCVRGGYGCLRQQNGK